MELSYSLAGEASLQKPKVFCVSLTPGNKSISRQTEKENHRLKIAFSGDMLVSRKCIGKGNSEIFRLSKGQFLFLIVVIYRFCFRMVFSEVLFFGMFQRILKTKVFGWMV